MSTPHFDRFQFDQRFARPVSKETRLSHDDYRSMQCYRHGATASVREIPAWTLDNEAVRRVLSARLARLANAPIPETLEELRVLDEKVVASMEKSASEYSRKGAAIARRAGGLAAYWVAVVYKTFRLGRNSVELASDLHTTPWAIRQTIWRLKWTAQQIPLGKYQRRNFQKAPSPEDEEKEIVFLYQQGRRLCDIRRQYKISGRRVRRILKRAGVWKISAAGAKSKAAQESAKRRRAGL